MVTNNGSNDVTVLDEKGLNNVFNSPQTVTLGSATLPIGVAIDPYTALVAITDTIISSGNNFGGFSTFTVTSTSSPTASLGNPIDYLPLGLAIDPAINNDITQAVAGVATASQTNAFDLVPLPTGAATRIQMQLPTGVVFDSLNQVFAVADSGANNVDLVDPLASKEIFTISVGINPTSLDYNFNTSTLVTSNSASNTLSIIDYVCPPNPNGVSGCPVPQVREVLDVGAVAPVVLGPNALAIDPRLNLAAVIDSANNRILLVPLPH